MVTSRTNMSKREGGPISHKSSKMQKNLNGEPTERSTGRKYDGQVVQEVIRALLNEFPLRVVPRGTELWHGTNHFLAGVPQLPFYGTPCNWAIRFGIMAVEMKLVRSAYLLDIRVRHRTGPTHAVGTDAKSDLLNFIKNIVRESTIADDQEKAKWNRTSNLDEIIMEMDSIDGWVADELAPCHNLSNVGHIDEMMVASEGLVEIKYIGPSTKEDMESSRFFATEPSYQDPTIGNPPPTLEEIERFEEMQEATDKPKDRTMVEAMRVYETERSKLQQLAVRLYIEMYGGSYHILSKVWRTVTKRNRCIHKNGPALTLSEKTEYNMLLCEAFNKMYPDAPYRANMWKKQPEEEYVDEEMPEDDDEEEEYSDDDY